MRFSHLFVVSFGRSGSTLLQGVLNSFPRTLIRGENNNFLYGLFQTWKSLGDPRFRKLTGNVRHPWHGYGYFSRRQFEDDIRHILNRNLLGTESEAHYDCLGFKEIRYLDMEDRAAFLDFLLRVFPNAGVILHHRDPADASDSHWWGKVEKATVVASMQSFIEFTFDFAESHRANVLITSFENITNEKRTDIKRICKFCNVPYNAAVIDKVLSLRHSVVGNVSRSNSLDSE